MAKWYNGITEQELKKLQEYLSNYLTLIMVSYMKLWPKVGKIAQTLHLRSR